MSIKKQADNTYLVDVRPSGLAGKRYRKKFSSKNKALKYEKFILAQHHNKNWIDKPKDTRKISELILLWYKHWGSHLKDGETDLRRVTSVNTLLGDPRVCDLNNKFLANFAAMRLQTIKATTYNRDIAVLQRIYPVN